MLTCQFYRAQTSVEVRESGVRRNAFRLYSIESSNYRCLLLFGENRKDDPPFNLNFK